MYDSIVDGANDKTHQCTDGNYIKTNEGYERCKDTPAFLNFCKGAPADDLHIHVPDEDFPNARWLSEPRCREMLTSTHLDELCEWAANKNHTEMINGLPMSNYCGCKKNLLVSTPVSAEYFWRMGPNETQADIYLRMARTTGVVGREYMTLFNGHENQDAVNSITDDDNAKTAMVRIPACWTSCSEFKRQTDPDRELIDAESDQSCIRSGCSNTINFEVLSGNPEFDINQLNQGCTYISQFGDAVGQPSPGGTSPGGTSEDKDDKDSKFILLLMLLSGMGAFFMIFMLLILKK